MCCFIPVLLSASHPTCGREGSCLRLSLGISRGDEQQRAQYAGPDTTGCSGHPHPPLSWKPSAACSHQGQCERGVWTKNNIYYSLLNTVCLHVGGQCLLARYSSNSILYSNTHVMAVMCDVFAAFSIRRCQCFSQTRRAKLDVTAFCCTVFLLHSCHVMFMSLLPEHKINLETPSTQSEPTKGNIKT